jgi:hypothetical protein
MSPDPRSWQLLDGSAEWTRKAVEHLNRANNQAAPEFVGYAAAAQVCATLALVDAVLAVQATLQEANRA